MMGADKAVGAAASGARDAEGLGSSEDVEG